MLTEPRMASKLKTRAKLLTTALRPNSRPDLLREVISPQRHRSSSVEAWAQSALSRLGHCCRTETTSRLSSRGC